MDHTCDNACITRFVIRHEKMSYFHTEHYEGLTIGHLPRLATSIRFKMTLNLVPIGIKSPSSSQRSSWLLFPFVASCPFCSSSIFSFLLRACSSLATVSSLDALLSLSTDAIKSSPSCTLLSLSMQQLSSIREVSLGVATTSDILVNQLVLPVVCLYWVSEVLHNTLSSKGNVSSPSAPKHMWSGLTANTTHDWSIQNNTMITWLTSKFWLDDGDHVHNLCDDMWFTFDLVYHGCHGDRQYKIPLTCTTYILSLTHTMMYLDKIKSQSQVALWLIKNLKIN